MDEKQLEQLTKVKTMLRSCVVSSPTAMDVNNLRRDYRELMGGPIPFFELGYRDILVFLKERCSDIFLLSGNPSNPTLVPVITKEISHINNFVAKQKIPSNKKYKGKRSSAYANVSSRFSPSSPQSYNTRRQTSDYYAPRSRRDTNYDYDPKWTRTIRGSGAYMKTNQDYTPSRHNTVDDHKNDEKFNNRTTCDIKAQSESIELREKVAPSDDNHIAGKACVADKRCDVNTDSAATQVDEKDYEKSDTDSGHNTGSTDLCRRKSDFLTNLSKLIAEYPEGIWSIELLKFYREKYDRELDFERRGFSSVIALCRSLPQVFSVQRPEPFGDWLLMDATTPLTPTCRLRVPQAKHRTEFMYKYEDALPGIEYDPSIYPPDCLHHLESIPRVELPNLDDEGFLEVIVSEVADPQHFWFQLRGKQHSVAMEAVMDEMSEYYIYGPGRTQPMVDGAIRVGQYCAARYQGDWHRAIVVQPLQRDKVKVRHIDYGTVERIDKSLVRPLPRCFAALPAQAIRGRLGAVRPPARAARWPQRAAQKLLGLVSDRALVGMVQTVDVENQIVTMSLVNTLGKEDVYIADELVNAGVAEAVPEECSPVTFEVACAYPPFEALESGKALNYADRAALIRCGVCPDDVEDSLDITPKPPQTLHSRRPLAHILQEVESQLVSSQSYDKLESVCNEGLGSQTAVEDVESEIVSEMTLGNSSNEASFDNTAAHNTCEDSAESNFTPLTYQSQQSSYQSQQSLSQHAPQMPYYQESPNYQYCPPAVHPYYQQYLYPETVQSSYSQVHPQQNIQMEPNVAQPVQLPAVCSLTAQARVELSMMECEIMKNLLRTDPAMAQHYLDDKRSQSINISLLQRQTASSTLALNCDSVPESAARGFCKAPPGYESMSLQRRARNAASNMQGGMRDLTSGMSTLFLNSY